MIFSYQMDLKKLYGYVQRYVSVCLFEDLSRVCGEYRKEEEVQERRDVFFLEFFGDVFCVDDGLCGCVWFLINCFCGVVLFWQIFFLVEYLFKFWMIIII